MIAACASCGVEASVRARGLWSRCYKRAYSRGETTRSNRADYVIAEVEFLAGYRGPDDLAQALGYRDFRGLERLLYRTGRYDLLRRVAPAEWSDPRRKSACATSKE